jgi:hypothetical protein
MGCVVVALAAMGVARAEQVVLVPPLDGTLYEGNPTTNANGVGSHFFVGKTAVGYRRRALMAFNFSSIPSGSTINSVSLSLSLDRGHGSTLAISMHRATAPWGEGTSNAGSASDGAGVAPTPGDVTWLHRVYPNVLWTTPGGDFDPVASATTTVSGVNFFAWSSPGLVSDVQGWLNNPASNFGWLMRCPETVEGASKRFVSGDSTNTFQVPMLTINFTRPPACRADLDNGSGTGVPDGAVNINDLLYYLVVFEAGVSNADLDNGSGTGTADGVVTIDDLLYFLVRFENGC